MVGYRGSNVISVAVTGHTSFDPDKVELIRGLVARALCEIKSSGGDELKTQLTVENKNKRGPRQLKPVVISCLAAGADQVVARVGLQLGYRLHAVLPGDAASYRMAIKIKNDEAAQNEARSEFDRLLSQKSSLTGIGNPLPGGDDDQSRNTRHVAYANANRYMLRHCDLLVAIADVIHRTDLGATGEAIRWAIRAGRPVVWIDPSRPGQLRWLSHLSEKEFRDREIQPPESCVVPDIAPDGEATAIAASPDSIDEAETGSFVVETLRRKVTDILRAKREALGFLAERMPMRRTYLTSRLPASLWSLLIEDWLPRKLPFKEAIAPDHGFRAKLAHWLRQIGSGYIVGYLMLTAYWNSWVKSFANKSKPAPAQSPKIPQTSAVEGPATDGEIVNSVVAEVEAARYRAKELAAFYAGAHRSSFLVLTILGVLAVALASFPVAILAHSATPTAAGTTRPAEAPAEEEGSSRATKIFATCELLVIVCMLGIYYGNRAFRWQEKSINYRLLSERFRNAVALILVGRDWLDTSALPLQYSDHQLHKTWIEPYFQRLTNRIEERLEGKLGNRSPRLCFDDDPAHSGYISSCRRFVVQKWLEVQAKYQKETAVKYEALNLLLEAVQFTMLILTIVICLLHFAMHLSLLSFFASVLPAISAALASLAGQAEVVRLRDRSISMHRAIYRRLRELAQTEKVSSAEALRSFVETTAQNMLGEVIEWRVLFKFRPISSPA